MLYSGRYGDLLYLANYFYKYIHYNNVQYKKTSLEYNNDQITENTDPG